MIRSMTGYSSVRSEEAGFSLATTVKSTNHRFLDVQVRLPLGLDALEPSVRRWLKARLNRGHVEVNVVLERAGAAPVEVNRPLLDAYIRIFRELRGELGFAGEPDLVALLRLPGMVVSDDGGYGPAEMEALGRALEKVVTQALDRLDEMRGREGETLAADLRQRLARLADLCAAIEKHAHAIPGYYQRRLQGRLKDFLPEGGANAPLDPARLAQEVAYLAARSDVTEELARFRSHLEQASRLLDTGPEIGKKLDFLLQELNREANTLLSKTTDVPEVGVEVARLAIEMKTEIEKLREQAQNIE